MSHDVAFLFVLKEKIVKSKVRLEIYSKNSVKAFFVSGESRRIHDLLSFMETAT